MPVAKEILTCIKCLWLFIIRTSMEAKQCDWIKNKVLVIHGNLLAMEPKIALKLWPVMVGGNSSKTLENCRRYLVMLGEPQCWSHNVKSLESSSLPGSCHFPSFLCIFPKLHSLMAASVHLKPKRYIKPKLI